MTRSIIQMAWTEIIQPKRSLFDLKIKEVWRYRDLLGMFIRRDFVATYKQTILGPLWFFIQPMLMTLMFTVVFGNFAKISTDGLTQILFYLSGITIWNYFSESFTKTSTVFRDNANIMGKVYFPRLIMPLSIVGSNLTRFFIQFLLFIAILVSFKVTGKAPNVQPQWMAIFLLTPVLLMMMAGFALGAGMIISALTTKYRDLSFLLTFGIQLLMYATPVIYPVSAIPDKYAVFIRANPLSSVVESFRYIYLGRGDISWNGLLFSFCCMIVMLISGMLIFNKVEKSFMDTV